jgi:hypothetical protein
LRCHLSKLNRCLIHRPFTLHRLALCHLVLQCCC